MATTTLDALVDMSTFRFDPVKWAEHCAGLARDKIPKTDAAECHRRLRDSGAVPAGMRFRKAYAQGTEQICQAYAALCEALAVAPGLLDGAAQYGEVAQRWREAQSYGASAAKQSKQVGFATAFVPADKAAMLLLPATDPRRLRWQVVYDWVQTFHAQRDAAGKSAAPKPLPAGILFDVDAVIENVLGQLADRANPTVAELQVLCASGLQAWVHTVESEAVGPIAVPYADLMAAVNALVAAAEAVKTAVETG